MPRQIACLELKPIAEEMEIESAALPPHLEHCATFQVHSFSASNENRQFQLVSTCRFLRRSADALQRE